ncbi:MAG: serine/threonine-protein phosphatase [Acidobacteria bacterium]|nr:serine/threonine-protein phosphatase [Acidobacteriota bacterium]
MRKNSDSLDVVTVSAPLPPTRDYTPLNVPLTPPKIKAAFLSDAGCWRATNQDCGTLCEPENDALLRLRGHLALVADGLGGHQGGATASQLAVETIREHYYATTASDPHAALEAAFHAANRAIHQAARRTMRLLGMGTTCTALALCGRHAYCAHVGDSRLYLLRDGAIYLMSEDHSAVMDLVRRGVLHRNDARQHADRNVLLRALGTRSAVNVACWEKPFPVRAADVFVLCSDGLHDLVTDAEIQEIAQAATPSDACAAFIALAKERGGHDNITAGVVRLAEA